MASMTEREFLTRMVALQNQIADVSKQFMRDNPDSDYCDCAEEELEDSAGDAVLYQFWLDGMPAASAQSQTPAPIQKKPGSVYIEK